MSDFLDNVADQLNLRWAWEKVRNQAHSGDVWFDQVELAGFELELERNLGDIAQTVKHGTYRLSPIHPIPFPKPRDKKGKLRIRQIFQVAVRDQVAWTALVNVVGPYVDSKMPVWSYGNRLYRSIWVEPDNDGIKRRKIGRYRHASGQLYLPFRQSWPIFRRHIYLTTRAMAKLPEYLPEPDEKDKEELEQQEGLPEKYRCPFINPKYWEDKIPNHTIQKLYWCSIDLKKFYPSLKLAIVRKNIVEQLPEAWKQEANKLIESMMQFKLDLSLWNNEELSQIGLNNRRKTFSHIPTGLYVAGFLANAGLMKVDQAVEDNLKKYNVAHLRFVDDHVILGYSFNDILKWVSLYINILSEEHTGAKINLEKVMPEEMAELITKRIKYVSEKKSTLQEKAEKACQLDPQFPSPLMTKTITLVSGIARTDFNLLDANELATLNDQLEHLLLADLPEEEMPQKTRLSFAATRLTQIAERKLSNDKELASLRYNEHLLDGRLKAIKGEISKIGIEKELEDIKGRIDDKENLRLNIEEELEGIKTRIDKQSRRLNIEIDSAFQLLRKALREQPSIIRLWSRAALMCRMTGVQGLRDLYNDINMVKEENSICAEYLLSNMLVILGEQAFVAARIIRDMDAASWRKEAAKNFLINLGELPLKQLSNGIELDHGILNKSWQLFSFGLYCSSIVLRDPKDNYFGHNSIMQSIIQAGLDNITHDTGKHAPAAWAWWAAQKTIRDLSPYADSLVQEVGSKLQVSPETLAFWRFFPLDVPPNMAAAIAEHDLKLSEGWWYDALRGMRIKEGHDWNKLIKYEKGPIWRAKRALEAERKLYISLYDWCQFLHEKNCKNQGDPRYGEWTVLEIMRQIANLIASEPPLVDYISRKPHSRSTIPLTPHPANFKIPRSWRDSEIHTWEAWHRIVKTETVEPVSEDDRIKDRRYTPIIDERGALFSELNPVRGLGLMLYGLLSCSFDLPIIWNGPGHSDILAMLPRLLINRMTCSSWTLGVLQGCLLARASENIFLRQKKYPDMLNIENTDDDTLKDPREFLSPIQVAKALGKCQEVLENYQISGINNRARQLIPVSIKQLTNPEWNKEFPFTIAGGIEDV